ncbi:MAG: hypothetical protein AVDCRST_MAG08-2489, partial [uncultured Acetobacteraceae bacterium]
AAAAVVRAPLRRAALRGSGRAPPPAGGGRRALRLHRRGAEPQVRGAASDATGPSEQAASRQLLHGVSLDAMGSRGDDRRRAILARHGRRGDGPTAAPPGAHEAARLAPL